jgi:hypothetical protein
MKYISTNLQGKEKYQSMLKKLWIDDLKKYLSGTSFSGNTPVKFKNSLSVMQWLHNWYFCWYIAYWHTDFGDVDLVVVANLI